MTYRDLRITAINNRICATGNTELLRAVSKLDYAKRAIMSDGQPFYHFPASRTHIMALESLCIPTNVTPEYIALRNQTMEIEISDLARGENTLLHRPMMQHQLEFCEFAICRRGTYNGSEQGTGKTMAACFLVAAWEALTNIIICPSSLCLQWKTEFENLYGGAYAEDRFNILVLNQSSVQKRIEYLQASVTADGRQNIIITNYESLVKLQPHFQAMIPQDTYRNTNEQPHAVIIADEAWKIKNPKAKSSIAARELSYWCDHVLALSGTPVCQGVSDLWAQLDFITNSPEEQMESIELFCARYEIPTLAYIGSRTVSKPGPCSDPMALMERIAPVFYRATKASALDLPEKFPTEKVMLEFTPQVRALYDSIKRNGMTVINPMLLEGNTVTQIRLQQMCGGWLYNAGWDETVTIDQDAFVQSLFAETNTGDMTPLHTPKTDWVIDFCNDELAENPQTRVIFWFVFNVELLSIAELIGNIIGKERVATIYGQDKHSDVELAQIKDSFNSKSPDGVQVICAQISKMAFGHNLQGCDTNVYYSHTHKYVLKAQSQDRSHRLGRVGGVRYIELVINNTIDETILAATDALQDMNMRLSPDTTSQVKDV